jgi:hypothetical protein
VPHSLTFVHTWYEAGRRRDRAAEEANQTLPQQVPAGFTLRRLCVEGDAVVAELESATP